MSKESMYWNKTYNPFIGCKKCSEACDNCWAEEMCERFPNLRGFKPHYTGNKIPSTKDGDVVFVGNMTDIFGDWMAMRNINGVLYQCEAQQSGARYLFCTKRADRLAEHNFGMHELTQSPFWYGVTCENQARADERIPHLLKAPVRNRWLSLEPLLSEIILDDLQGGISNDCFGNIFDVEPYWSYLDAINWVVVGAESGANRRPCRIEWVESIVEQCKSANTPVWVKQLDINGKCVSDIDKFPAHLQIRQTPWR